MIHPCNRDERKSTSRAPAGVSHGPVDIMVRVATADQPVEGGLGGFVRDGRLLTDVG